MAVFHGTKHDDNFNESSDTGNDVFDLYKGGNDTVIAGSGNDRFNMGAALNAGDRLDGGAGNDVVFLHGDYSAGVVFDDQTIQNIETIRLGPGFNYDLTTADGNVAAGETLTINARALGALHSLIFDGSAETDGRFVFYAGLGNDTITGGAKNDRFNLETGGNDTVHGGGGNDVFVMGNAFTSGDVIDGGAGNDTVTFNGGPNRTLFGSAISSIETLDFLGGNGTTTIVGDIAGGSTLNINAVSRVLLDLTAATSSAYVINATSSFFSTVTFGGNFTSSDVFHNTHDNGGLIFKGDYSGGLTLSGPNLSGVQSVNLDDGFSYAVSVVGQIGESGGGFVSLVSQAGAGHTVSFDLTQSTALALSVKQEGAGAVSVKFAGNLHSADEITGSVAMTVELDGDYASGLTLGGSGGNETLFRVNTLKLDDGFSYKLAMDEDNNGVTLAVDASALTAGHTLNFDASGDSSAVAITGGAGDDTLSFAGNFTASDSFNGGAGNDTLSLNGDYSAGLTFDASTITNVETLILSGGAYNITTNDGNVAAGKTLTVDATALTTAQALTFDGSAEQDGNFVFEFGTNFTANDKITGGAGNDTLSFNGSHSYALSDTAITSVEAGQFIGNVNYSLTVTGDIADGSALSIDASAARQTTLNLAAATSASYAIKAGLTSTTINFAGNFSAADTIVGAGRTTLNLTGDYSSGLNISSANVTDIDSINLQGDHSYTISVTGDITGGHRAGIFALTSGAADVNVIDLTQAVGLYEALNDGAGQLTVKFGGNFNSNDFVGGHITTVELDGDYSGGLNFIDQSNQRTLSQVTTLKLDDGFSYKLVMNEDNDGIAMNVDATALTAGHTLNFDGTNDPNSLIFKFGGNFTTADVLKGGSGTDTLELNGEYHNGSAYTFAADQLAGIDTLKLDAGHSYNLTWNDTDLAAGKTLTVDGSALNTTALIFDGTAEQDGNFHFIAGADSSILKGGDGNDIFDLTGAGGAEEFRGGNGDDTFLVGANFNNFFAANNGAIDGGAGNDTLEFNGDYSSVIVGLSEQNLETIRFDGGHSYGNVTIGQVTSPALVTVDASQVSTLFHLTLDTTAYLVEVGSGGMVASIGNGATQNDTFIVTSEAALSASTLDAGNGTDTLELNGDFSLGLTLGATTIANFETIKLDDGHSYSLGTNDANVAAGATLTIDASALTGSNILSFEGTAETDGHFAFISGAGGDIITGGKLSDTFDMSRSNGAAVSGFDGNDTFTFTTSASLLSDSVDGGAGTDTLILNGDFSTQTALTHSNLTSIEAVQLLGAANSYNLTVADAISSAITIDATALTSSSILHIDASGDTSTAITLQAGADFSNADSFFGGAGNDTLELSGTYLLTLTSDFLTDVETIKVDAGHSYDLTVGNDQFLSSGHTLTVDGSGLGAGDSLIFDGSVESDGAFILKGGAGNDTLAGGEQADTLTGGGGEDTFVYGVAADSNGTHTDHITDFDGDSDQIEVGFNVTSVHQISANLDNLGMSMSAALAGHLDASGAVVVTATSGALAGHVFLVVDYQGSTSYSATNDLVIDITGGTHLNDIATTTFF